MSGHTRRACPLIGLLSQRPEPRSHLVGKELWLFPGRKMPAPVERVVVDQVVGSARSAQLRGAWYSSPGRTLMANGMETLLASKKPALFSQYRRAEEIPVFVSQYCQQRYCENCAKSAVYARRAAKMTPNSRGPSEPSWVYWPPAGSQVGVSRIVRRRRRLGGAFVPSVEWRVVACVPCFA